MVSPTLERRARVLNGIPRAVDPATPWWRRLLTSPYLWGTLVLLGLGFLGLWDMYAMMHPDTVLPDDGGVVYGIQPESFKLAAKWAWPTAAAYVSLFLLLDRFRRQNLAMYVMGFVWGGAMSTWFSIYVNTWAGEVMGVTGQDPSTGARSAVFSAPFVEEVSKAAIIFLLAILLRYRLTSMLQTVSLAGITAIGFAFVENIVYYARAHNYATQTPGIEDPAAAVMSLVKLRGLYASFGHPLFTTMTAIGLAVGLRHRSKIVRVCAPVAGFCFAALGHMAFNGIASTVPEAKLKTYWFMGLGLVAMLVINLVGQVIAEGRRLRARLTDFVRMGWLEPSDPFMYSRLRSRVAMITIALFQPRRLLPTLKVMRRMTELAFLRDQMVRGLVDDVGYERARELLDQLNGLRPVAVTTSAAPERIVWPKLRLPAWAAAMRRRPVTAGQQWAPPGA